MTNIVLQEVIEQKIYLIRDHKVMIDYDLAHLYGVETKQLKRAVKRNIERFPDDFMFILSSDEYRSLRCQIGTLNRGAHAKYPPYAFTQEGVAMLSSVLNSERAIQVNIQIMRTFIKLRRIVETHKDLFKKINEMEKRYDKQFRIVFEAIRELMASPKEPKRRIGFIAN